MEGRRRQYLGTVYAKRNSKIKNSASLQLLQLQLVE